MVALLRKVDSVWCKELGRWTGRRSPPMEQTPPAQACTREEVGKKFFWLIQAGFGATLRVLVNSVNHLSSRSEPEKSLCEASQFFEKFFIDGFLKMITIGMRTRLTKVVKSSCKY